MLFSVCYTVHCGWSLKKICRGVFSLFTVHCGWSLNKLSWCCLRRVPVAPRLLRCVRSWNKLSWCWLRCHRVSRCAHVSANYYVTNDSQWEVQSYASCLWSPMENYMHAFRCTVVKALSETRQFISDNVQYAWLISRFVCTQRTVSYTFT